MSASLGEHWCYTGATLTSKEKLDIARQLSKLGVDIIEAGFPVASPDDFEAVRGIAMDVGNAVDEDGYVPVICGLSRYALLHCLQIQYISRLRIQYISTSQLVAHTTYHGILQLDTVC